MYGFIQMLKEKRSFLFLAIPFVLILLFIIFSIILLQSPEEKTGQPTVTGAPGDISPTLTEEETMEIQEQSDREFGEQQAEVLRKYPWYNSLPLQEDTYFVYLDSETGSFVGLLYPQRSSSLSEEDQVAAMKEEINTSLINLGIDISTYPFDWQITPEP